MAYENQEIKETLELTYDTMQGMGYNALNQLTGYILSGDPSYISTRNGVRSKMDRLDRDDIVLELLKAYLKK